MSDYQTTAKKFYEIDHTSNDLKKVIEQAMHRNLPAGKAIDIGCGDAHIIGKDARFEGLEASTGMIEQIPPTIRSRIHHGDIADEKSIAELAERYTIATANYVFIEMPEAALRMSFANVYRILEKGGEFRFTITHPETRDKTFPGYRSVFTEVWRKENRDQPFAVQFATENGWIDLAMTDYHNPTEVYVKTLEDAGFRDITLTEVQDPSGLVAKLNAGEDVPFGMIVSAKK